MPYLRESAVVESRTEIETGDLKMRVQIYEVDC